MRAALFWWLFKTMDRSWWARFLERYGAPFAVAKYEDGRDDTRAQLTRAFQAATKLFGLVVTKGTDVELLQANASQSGDAFEKFKTTADNELSKLVLGATGTTTMTGGGIGGSQADVHNEVRGDYEGFDAIKLAETLQDQLVDPFCQINALRGRCKILIGQEDPGSAEETRKSLKTLKECDLELEEDGIAIVSRRLQLPIRRATTPAPVDAPKPPVKSLSVDEDPRDALVEEFAPGVAKAFGQEAAALLPRPGQTPATYVKELQNSLVSMAPHRSVRALELALQAFCAEGA